MTYVGVNFNPSDGRLMFGWPMVEQCYTSWLSLRYGVTMAIRQNNRNNNNTCIDYLSSLVHPLTVKSVMYIISIIFIFSTTTTTTTTGCHTTEWIIWMNELGAMPRYDEISRLFYKCQQAMFQVDCLPDWRYTIEAVVFNSVLVMLW